MRLEIESSETPQNIYGIVMDIVPLTLWLGKKFYPEK